MAANTSPPTNPGGQPPIRIAIIGAGIAGTCLAIGLLEQQEQHQPNYPRLDVHLYESRADLSVRGAGLALHGNAIAAMDAISPAVKRAYFRSAHHMASDADLEMATSIVLADGSRAGTLVAELGRARGRRTVHRAHFIRALLDELRPALRVRFGMRLVGLRQEHGGEVEAAFADGSTARFDALFAADGARSAVARAHVLGPTAAEVLAPVNRDGWRCFNARVPADTARSALPPRCVRTVRMLCAPLGYVNGLPVDRGRTYSVTAYVREGKRDAGMRGRGFEVEEWVGRGWGDEIESLVLLLAKHNPTESWQILDHDPAPTYVRGRAALVGDAAHATGPHAGNGAAQAIEDAAVLTGLFAALARRNDNGEGIEAALRAYDAVRRPRSQRVVEITREFGRLYTLDEDERDVQAMRERLAEGGRYTNMVDMGEQVRGAVERLEREMGGEERMDR